MRLCRWCGAIITPTETQVGFGTGTGNDFVHKSCWDSYSLVANQLTTEIREVFKRFVHMNIKRIRDTEDYINRMLAK